MKCKGGYLTTILMLLCLSVDILNSSPVSPCPQVFNYRFDGVEWYGVISVPSPQQYGSSIKLNVQMSIPTSLPNNNAGHIELVGPRADVVQAALYGRNIEYNVRFPLPSVVPTITGIILNDNIICSGPPVTGPVVTSLKLQHILFPDSRRQNTIPSTSRPSSNVQIYEYDFGSHPAEEPTVQIFDEYGNQITNSGQQYSSFNNQNQPHSSFNNQPNEWSYSNQPNSNNYWNTQNKPYNNNGQQYNPSQSNPNQNNAFQTNPTYPNSFSPTQNTDTQYYNPSQYKPNQNSYSQNTYVTNPTNPNAFSPTQNVNTQYYNPSQYKPNQNSYSQNTPVTSRPNNNNYPVQSHQTNNPYYNPTTVNPNKLVTSRVTPSYKPPTRRPQQNTSQRRKPGNTNSVAPVASSQPLNTPVTNFNQQSNNYPKPVVSAFSQSGSFREQYSNLCGVTAVGNPLIANGQTTIKGEFPWLAALFSQKTLGLEFRCSASLITNRHVVTAGHCIKYGDNPALKETEILIILGKYNIRRWTEQGTLIMEVEQIHLHPNYGNLGFDADLAVISFIRTVEFNTQVRPICMWNESEDLLRIVGQFATVVGWGRDEKGQRITDEPKLARIPIVSQEDCLRSKEEFRHYTSNRTLCAGLRNGTGPCNGDSGGALLLHRNNRWFIRGVVSLSLIDPTTRSCDLSQYTVFTDVAKYKNWLLQFFI